MFQLNETTEELKVITNKINNYYLVSSDAVRMHANALAKEVLDEIKQLLNELFMRIKKDFVKEELFECINLILKIVCSNAVILISFN